MVIAVETVAIVDPARVAAAIAVETAEDAPAVIAVETAAIVETAAAMMARLKLTSTN